MLKNVAGQKICIGADDYSTGAPKTGDAANITLYVSKDGGAVTALTDTSATELSSTNAPGVYQFDLSQAETNADILVFTGKSATANVRGDPYVISISRTALGTSGMPSANAFTYDITYLSDWRVALFHPGSGAKLWALRTP